MSQKREIEQAFSAEQKGDRVGWVRVAPIENSTFAAIDIVTTSVVGDEGAEFGAVRLRHNDDEVESLPFPYQVGFGYTAAFSAILSPERTRQEEFNLMYTPQDHKIAGSSYGTGRAEELLAHGTADTRRYEQNAEKVWTKNPAELLDTLQQLLADVALGSAYQSLYYWMNGAIGREQPNTSSLHGADMRRLLMPDANMNYRTREDTAHMSAMNTALLRSVTNDVRMRSKLLQPSNEAAVLLDAFVHSRDRAADLEREIGAEAEKLAVKRLAFLPTGQGRSGRTWPYMDASESDADKAYGLELRDLRAGSANRAVHEIDEEVKELEARRTLAFEALQRFVLLSELERSI